MLAVPNHSLLEGELGVYHLNKGKVIAGDFRLDKEEGALAQYICTGACINM